MSGLAFYYNLLPSLLDWTRLTALSIPTLIVIVIVGGAMAIWPILRFDYRRTTQSAAAQTTNLLFSGSEASEDRLGRNESVVQHLVWALEHPHTEEALVIAVTGKWGNGKSTVIKLARQKLKEDDFIFVQFNPWLFSVGHGQNLDLILARFFSALEAELAKQVFRPKLGQLLQRYYKLVEPVFKQAPLNLTALLGETSNDLVQTQKELKNAFAALTKTVVVIIDDLDRMSGVEIAFVFKLVHLCLDFPKMCYVLAFN